MKHPKKTIPNSTIMWTLTDKVIENSEVLEQQFFDIINAGFDGIAPFVRCSRYNWAAKPARQAIAHVRSLCEKHEIKLWLFPDPRFISRTIVQKSKGLPVLLCGEQVIAEKVPQLCDISNGSFNIRCHVPPRKGHMINEVGIEFTPVKLAAVYAVRDKDVIADDDIVDITSQAQLFYNAFEHYAEAFGKIKIEDEENWKVMAFFETVAIHFDFSNPQHLTDYISILVDFAKETGQADAFLWDEPGYTCVYGAFPFSEYLQNNFLKKTGMSLQDNLWKLVSKTQDNSHIRVRSHYFNAVQQSVNNAQKKSWDAVKKIWGEQTACGIHDTWHFEMGDMADMNHGSMDLWKGLISKDGGYVDLGAINYLKEPDSFYYKNFAALSMMCKSLGVFSQDKYAFNNMWTIGDDDGEGWQVTVMDYCVNAMIMLGQRWLAHIYGPVGVIGEEAGFLGSPPMPGHPDHSTWPHYPEWNERYEKHLNDVQHKLPEANVLVVFPAETMYAAANAACNKTALEVFDIILDLMDRHYQIDVVSSVILEKGKWQMGQFAVNDSKYDLILLPFANILPDHIVSILSENKDKVMFVESVPETSTNGEKIEADIQHYAKDRKTMIDLLDQMDLKTVQAPDNCWVSVTQTGQGRVISLCPARHTYCYEGNVSFNGQQMNIDQSKGLTRILFPENGQPQILFHT